MNDKSYFHIIKWSIERFVKIHVNKNHEYLHPSFNTSPLFDKALQELYISCKRKLSIQKNIKEL